MPAIFLPHGGGPWPFVELDFGGPKDYGPLAAYLRGLSSVLPEAPKAVVVISAHWEERVPTVQTAAAPPLLFDYYGFPPESYRITWPAPGAPAIAARVRDLLTAAGIASGENGERGFDHGAFVPLKLAFPDAEIPTIQLSLVAGLEPERHLAIGRALAPLRDEGVLIIGSGMTFHNLRAFGDPRARPIAVEFDRWLQAAATAPQAERDRALAAWTTAPHARLVHPREEHLIPLHVIAGAAGPDRGTIGWSGTFAGFQLSAIHYAA